MRLLDVLTQQLVRVKLLAAERTQRRLGRNAQVRAQVDAQVVLVLVSARAQSAVVRSGVGVHWQVLLILRLEEESFAAELAAVNLLFCRGGRRLWRVLLVK